MKQAEIKEKIGKDVGMEDMVNMIDSMPICSTSDDVGMRSGMLSFSFGPSGVVLTDVENREKQI